MEKTSLNKAEYDEVEKLFIHYKLEENKKAIDEINLKLNEFFATKADGEDLKKRLLKVIQEAKNAGIPVDTIVKITVEVLNECYNGSLTFTSES